MCQVWILNPTKETHHQAILINQKWHLPVWVCSKWKVTSHSPPASSPLGQSGGWGQFRTPASEGPTSPQTTIPFILFAFTSLYLKLEVLFHLKLSVSSLVKTFQFSWGLSWDGEKAHPQLSVLLSHFTSIRVLPRRWGSRIGIILSSGDAVMPPPVKYCSQRDNDK